MRVCLLVLMMVALAVPAGAQVSLGAGSMFTFINDGKTTRDVGDLFGEIEYQAPIADHSWLGAVIATDGGGFGGFAGIGIRYYYGSADAAVFPGIGVATFRYTGKHQLIDEFTMLLGGELVVEMNVPWGESSLPLVLLMGHYPSIDGADISMSRFGVKLAPDLLQGTD